MKKRYYLNIALAVVAIVSSAYRCCYDHEDYVRYEGIDGAFSGVVNNDWYYYYGSAGFSSNVFAGAKVVKNGKGENESIGSNDYYSRYYYSYGAVETRLLNGWSNWKSLHKNQYQNTKRSESVDCDHYYYYYVDASECTSPPTYLHLVLDSLADTKAGTYRNTDYWYSDYIKGKEWVVTELVDSTGADLANDPDWACFMDNYYAFLKDGKVIYYPGATQCDGEESLGGHIVLYYTISSENLDHNNPGKITMTLSGPDVSEDIDYNDFGIEIIASDFDEIKGIIKNSNGGSATITIQPKP